MTHLLLWDAFEFVVSDPQSFFLLFISTHCNKEENFQTSSFQLNRIAQVGPCEKDHVVGSVASKNTHIL